MSVLIKHMAMPKGCIYANDKDQTEYCPLLNHDDVPFCQYIENEPEIAIGIDERPVYCPLSDVPEPCQDAVSRQAAIARAVPLNLFGREVMIVSVSELENLPSAQPEQRWIPTSEKLPDELAEVNITWENTEPEPYYDFVKGHCFTGTAVYFRGRWYWYSAVCVDYLREYGFSPNDEMDDAIKVLAWMPLPEPYRAKRRTDG